MIDTPPGHRRPRLHRRPRNYGAVMAEQGYRVPEVCRIVGISYRQLDYWARTELVPPSIRDAQGSGPSACTRSRISSCSGDQGTAGHRDPLQQVRKAVETCRTSTSPRLGDHPDLRRQPCLPGGVAGGRGRPAAERPGGLRDRRGQGMDRSRGDRWPKAAGRRPRRAAGGA